MLIQDIAALVLAFTVGLTVGLTLCYLICRKSNNLVVQQRPNQPVEQAAVPAQPAPRRRNGIQRNERKQPTEHDERLAWVSSETAVIQNLSVTCGLVTICTRSIFVRRVRMESVSIQILNTKSFFGYYSLAPKTDISSCPRCSLTILTVPRYPHGHKFTFFFF